MFTFGLLVLLCWGGWGKPAGSFCFFSHPKPKNRRCRCYENRMSAFVRKDHKRFECFFFILAASFSFSLFHFLTPSLPLTLLPPPNFCQHSAHGQGKSRRDGGGGDAAVRKGGQQAQEKKHLCTPWVPPRQRIPGSYRVSNVFGCLCTVRWI